MRINLIQSKEILEVETEIGHELVATERAITAASPARLKRFCVSFKDAEEMTGGCLVGHSGNGDTIDEALKDYANQISCLRMVFGAFTNDRTEIVMPKLTHTKLIGQ